jgi:pimeloyl-ACP methyl ester carboxylesterase
MARGELDGWRYGYTDEGAGPAVILLHGLQMDRSIWDRQVEGLRDAYRVVTLDAPGHGESAPVPLGIDFWRYADMVVGVCDQLGLDAPAWGGHSMGGFTAIRAALRHPDRVRALVLVDTQAHAEDPAKLAQYEAFLTVAREQGITEDLASVVLRIYFGEAFASSPEGEAWRKKLLSADVDAQLPMIRAVFDRDDVHDRLGEIRCPSLVVHGALDVAIEPERGEELARALGARYVRIDGAGHCPPVEASAAVAAAIRSFLDELPR